MSDFDMNTAVMMSTETATLNSCVHPKDLSPTSIVVQSPAKSIFTDLSLTLQSSVSSLSEASVKEDSISAYPALFPISETRSPSHLLGKWKRGARETRLGYDPSVKINYAAGRGSVKPFRLFDMDIALQDLLMWWFIVGNCEGHELKPFRYKPGNGFNKRPMIEVLIAVAKKDDSNCERLLNVARRLLYTQNTFVFTAPATLLRFLKCIGKNNSMLLDLANIRASKNFFKSTPIQTFALNWMHWWSEQLGLELASTDSQISGRLWEAILTINDTLDYLERHESTPSKTASMTGQKRQRASIASVNEFRITSLCFGDDFSKLVSEGFETLQEYIQISANGMNTYTQELQRWYYGLLVSKQAIDSSFSISDLFPSKPLCWEWRFASIGHEDSSTISSIKKLGIRVPLNAEMANREVLGEEWPTLCSEACTPVDRRPSSPKNKRSKTNPTEDRSTSTSLTSTFFNIFSSLMEESQQGVFESLGNLYKFGAITAGEYVNTVEQNLYHHEKEDQQAHSRGICCYN